MAAGAVREGIYNTTPVILNSCSNTAVRISPQLFKVNGLRPFMAAGAIDGKLSIEITVILDSCSNTVVKKLASTFQG